MFRKAKQGSLVGDMVAQIEEAIVTGQFKAGDKLPPSRELEETLGTSRGTLREAIRILEQKGLVQVKVGVKGGIFVREATTEPLSESLGLLIRQLKISRDDLAEFRMVVEAGLVRRVVARATMEDVTKLKDRLAEMEIFNHQGPEGWTGLLAVEVQVRKELIRIAASRMYEAVLIPIHENIFAYTDRYLPSKPGITEEAFADWSKIISAIGSGDEAEAVKWTVSHIARFAEHWSKEEDLENGRQTRE